MENKMKHCFLRKFGYKSTPVLAADSPNLHLRDATQVFGLLRDATLRGWRIFPVLNFSRYAVGTSAMLAHATNDMEQLEAWYIQHPGCNWALATGSESGVLAIEIEGRIGSSSFSWLFFDCQKEQVCNPPTLISKIENGVSETVYAYFRWPATSARRLLHGVIAPGLRLRGEGESVLIPPSVRRDGNRYHYIQPAGVVEVASMPDWLIELVSNPMEDTVHKPEIIPP